MGVMDGTQFNLLYHLLSKIILRTCQLTSQSSPLSIVENKELNTMQHAKEQDSWSLKFQTVLLIVSFILFFSFILKWQFFWIQNYRWTVFFLSVLSIYHPTASLPPYFLMKNWPFIYWGSLVFDELLLSQCFQDFLSVPSNNLIMCLGVSLSLSYWSSLSFLDL